MKKMKLRLEDLSVESFNVVNNDSKKQGTINGNGPTPYSNCGDMTCGNTGCGECGSDDCGSNYCSNACPTQQTCYTCESCLVNTCRTDVPHHCYGEKTIDNLC